MHCSDPTKCIVLVPVYGSLDPETEQGLNVLAERGYVVRLLRNSSQIDLARSTMATRAMRNGFEETLWIDADTVFRPEDVEQLRSHDLPIVAGLYLKKKQGKPEFAGKFRSPKVTFGVGGGLLEMVYVGMGFTLIRREVYAELAEDLIECTGGYDGETVIPFFRPTLAPEGATLDYLSEDFSFCHRARIAGFAVMADTTIKLGHAGRYVYTWDEFAPRPTFDCLQLGVEPATNESPPAISEATMNEMQWYEKIGRKQARIEELEQQKAELVQLLAKVVSGEIDRSRVLVNLTVGEACWAEQGCRPGMPATVNGLPRCVVAPDEPSEPETIAAMLADDDTELTPAQATMLVRQRLKEAAGVNGSE